MPEKTAKRLSYANREITMFELQYSNTAAIHAQNLEIRYNFISMMRNTV